jgi:VWFA-related protein
MRRWAASSSEVSISLIDCLPPLKADAFCETRMIIKKTTALTAALTLLLPLFVLLVRAQQQWPTAKPGGQEPETSDDRDDVVRITTSLVQVDATVTKAGKQVTDLTAAEFEIFEDGRPKKITSFSYVSNESSMLTEAPVAAANPLKATDKLAPPNPPRRLRPEEIRRTMALVVDDLSLSFDTTESARYALRRFVNEQMQANDLVAIVRTSAGVGALQQFTSDKRQLNAAIDRVKWYLARGGRAAFAAIEVGDANLKTRRADSMIKERGPNDRDSEAELKKLRDDLSAEGTIGALNFVVRGMRNLPGRKSVILLSEGFTLPGADPAAGTGHDRVADRLHQLIDLANRTAVVFYAVDVRGLVYAGLTAADNVAGRSPADVDALLFARERALLNTQNGVEYLAKQTGGFLMKNSNDIPGLIKRVVEDQKGYYLIGYRPETTTFDRRFHQIKVKVKRPNLSVRSRSGFYGIGNEERRALPSTRNQQLHAALTSPFAAPGVDLRLATFFTNTAQDGSFMRSLMYIDGRDLTFTKQPDGMYQTTLDVIGVSFDGSGRLIDASDRIQTLNLKEDTYLKSLRDGLIYSFNVQIKKPGAYQLRMAVRDTASERTGSANQFIEVPDLKKNRLVLSGLIVSGVIAAEASKEGAAAPAGDLQLVESGPNPFTSTTVRRFRRNSTLAFGYVIYNARLDKTNLPQLTAQTRIFRDNKPVYVGNVMLIDATGQPDLKRINIGTQLQLGNSLPPGEYVLQVIIRDTLANEKYGTATQWIDFEIVK